MNDIVLKYSQLGKIFDYFSMGVMILSPDRKILSVNRSAELITGYKASELNGKYCYRIFLEDLCGGDCKFYESAEPDLKAKSQRAEITEQRREKRSISKIVSPVYGSDQEILGCIEVFQDHSALKDLIERIGHDDRRLKIILDNLDTGVLTVDCGGYITFFNTTAETITGYGRREVLGKSCNTIFGKDSYAGVALLTETISDGKARSSEDGEIRTRHGQAIPIRANYMALKNEEGRIVGGLATISDLSLLYQLDSAIKDRYTFYDMVGRDPAMQKIFETLPVVASSDATVLIEGSTGTGKDVLAKVIHNASLRSSKPLVKVNCAALPDNLLESEMFGYVKGAFTGAEKDNPGRFQEADGGTIFLDEIGDLPLSLQAKLLRVLEDKEFYPLGSRKTTKVDVRIITATNQLLERLVKEKRFRADLYYRLNVMRFELPPLKDRKGDIPLLVSHILKRFSATRVTRAEKLSEDAMEVLLNYDYPGNIRELENIIEHALIVCQGKIIERKHLPVPFQEITRYQEDNKLEQLDLDQEIEASEKKVIEATLKKHHWDRTKTAKALNINRTTLWRKMKKYSISL
ncbi:MAG: sigma 54-interacting transcriptional regulator [Deltaproteobacteria bacterium]|nr:MAG: sigma 54-interacting transcriptional regulator [Deltaproteobacteria bacterium]